MASTGAIKRKHSDEEASSSKHARVQQPLLEPQNDSSIDSDESLLEDDTTAMPDDPLSNQPYLSVPPDWHKTSALPAGISPPQMPLERSIPDGPEGPMELPAAKVFPIQVGSKLFSLSGASLSSDAPSYFSRFFKAQLDSGVDATNVKTLYLDRDPETFTDISLHLQGYYVEPRDGAHFTRLFADAQFFNLPRLIQRLFKSDIFVRVGEREFRIAKDLLEGPGDSPNYFNLGFGVFFATSDNLYPGLRSDNLLRPPAMKPPRIESRDPDVFGDLLRVLQGYEDVVRDERHREALLRDARYYHLRGLEQKLIPCKIGLNLFEEREEITLRLQDLKPAGMGLNTRRQIDNGNLAADLSYARPHVDQSPRHLVISVPEGKAYLSRKSQEEMVLVFAPVIRGRIVSLHRLLYTKWREERKEEAPLLPQEKQEKPRAVISEQSHVTITGIDGSSQLPEVGRRWALGKSMWSVSSTWSAGEGLTVTWTAVRVEAYADERAANGAQEWI